VNLPGIGRKRQNFVLYERVADLQYSDFSAYWFFLKSCIAQATVGFLDSSSRIADQFGLKPTFDIHLSNGINAVAIEITPNSRQFRLEICY